ncbi:MAG: 30S ribosomal protein S1 [Kiritimatiellae bacterium]|jgi:small subunit ribosomal protein S1|nr:30S ribosomal protein S1 [Kiritimatiellia bacterium]
MTETTIKQTEEQVTDEALQVAMMYEETLKDFSAGSIVVGKILELQNNEVLIDIGYKSEGVVPADEFSDIENVKIGDEVSVLLVDIEDDDGMVVLSKSKADEKLQWDNVISNYNEDDLITGTVISKVRGGLIIDIDGVEAFLPGSQIDVVPIKNIDDLVGTSHEFKILKITPERRNVILSRRALIEERLKRKKKVLMDTIEKGQLRLGFAKNITDFGVFVDLDGLDGLLHITDMSWGRIKHPTEMVTVGDDLEVMILDIDYDKERVSLGLKQKVDNPWVNIDEKYPVGTQLCGKVVNIAPYGAFVELENGVEGLVHISEISWTKRIVRASDVLSVGDEVDVVVLSINMEDQKIALGMRQTEENPWDTVHKRYPVGSKITGKVRNFTSYGAFVELEDGIDGMIHVSDMSWTRKINHPTEVLKKGAEVEAVVLEVNPQENRISLGLKQAQDDPWNTIEARYEVGQKVTGVVTKVASFGAFIEIEEGVDALVHISQISNDHVEKVKDALNVGDPIEARVIKIDRAERRIGLSIKAGVMDESEFNKQKDDIVDGLQASDDMVNLAGAFDDAFSIGDVVGEEWEPSADKK